MSDYHLACQAPELYSERVLSRRLLSTNKQLALVPDGDCVYFLHWRQKLPPRLLKRVECIGFHMTNLPYGRGGTPLQNLILRGRKSTVLSMYRMTPVFDAGPIYARRSLSLEGSAHEIYKRTGDLALDMIQAHELAPTVPRAQEGKVVVWKRLGPETGDLSKYPRKKHGDIIRMLDAPGYPHAFLRVPGGRIEFRDWNGATATAFWSSKP